MRAKIVIYLKNSTIGDRPLWYHFAKMIPKGSVPNGTFLEFGFEEAAGVGGGAGGNLLGGTANYKVASALSALGTEVNYMVCTFYHVHVVLYDYYGVAATDKGIECI